MLIVRFASGDADNTSLVEAAKVGLIVRGCGEADSCQPRVKF